MNFRRKEEIEACLLALTLIEQNYSEYHNITQCYKEQLKEIDDGKISYIQWKRIFHKDFCFGYIDSIDKMGDLIVQIRNDNEQIENLKSAIKKVISRRSDLFKRFSLIIQINPKQELIIANDNHKVVLNVWEKFLSKIQTDPPKDLTEGISKELTKEIPKVLTEEISKVQAKIELNSYHEPIKNYKVGKINSKNFCNNFKFVTILIFPLLIAIVFVYLNKHDA